MLGDRFIGWGMLAVAVLGTVAAARGVATDVTSLYRTGVILLILGCSGLLMHQVRRLARRVMEHQKHLSDLGRADRQEWAEYGYRAGRYDPEAVEEGAQIALLPCANPPRRGA